MKVTLLKSFPVLFECFFVVFEKVAEKVLLLIAAVLEMEILHRKFESVVAVEGEVSREFKIIQNYVHTRL